MPTIFMLFWMFLENKCVCQIFKCEFCLTSVKFLGHVISKEVVMVDPQEIEVVKNWIRPSFVTELGVLLQHVFTQKRI